MARIDVIGKTDVMGRDGFTWWVGEVESIKDPQKIGRVKVRIVGWYTGHGEVAYKDDIPTDALPWSSVLLPTDQAGIKNTGTSTQLQVGATVLGFFLDGEEAQLPVVMGSIHGMRNLSDSKSSDGDPETGEQISATVVADSKEALTDEEMNPQSKAITGETVHSGNQFTVIGGDTPGDEQGGEEKSRGVISILEQMSPGHYATNPLKIPAEAFGIADGIGGPTGEGFDKDLDRMLTELGNLSGSLAQGRDGNLVSLITGKKVKNDIIVTSLAKVKQFVANSITGVMSSLKQLLAEQISALIGGVTSALSSIAPLGIITKLLSLASKITALFCNFEASYILGAINGAINNIDSFADSIASNIVDKVIGGIADKVNDTVNAVIGKIQGAIGRVAGVAQKVSAAIAVAKNIAGVARKVVGALKSLFAFDFSKINWGSLISIIIGIITSLFGNKDCGRSLSPPKQKFWLPLFGTSECASVPEYLQQEIEINTGTYGTDGGYTGSKTKGDYFSDLMQGIDSYATQVTTFLNGAAVIQDNTKGKEKTIVTHAGGQTTIATAMGDQHINMPGNSTAIIGGDDCCAVKGNKTVTIEGDYTLKVMGNFNVEVLGTRTEHISQGVGTDDSGNPNPQQQKASTTYSSDYDLAIEGDWKAQTANTTINAVNNLDLNATATTVKSASLMNSISGEIINECQWKTEFIANAHFVMIATMNPLPAITGRLSIIKGPDITICGTGIGLSPMPAAHIRIAETGAKGGGMLDTVVGAKGGHMTVVTAAKGVIGELAAGPGGGIVNVVPVGQARYNVGAGKMVVGTAGGPTQIIGLPIFLN